MIRVFWENIDVVFVLFLIGTVLCVCCFLCLCFGFFRFTDISIYASLKFRCLLLYSELPQNIQLLLLPRVLPPRSA